MLEQKQPQKEPHNAVDPRLKSESPESHGLTSSYQLDLGKIDAIRKSLAPKVDGGIVPIPNAIDGLGEIIPLPNAEGKAGMIVPIPNAELPEKKAGQSEELGRIKELIEEAIPNIKKSTKEKSTEVTPNESTNAPFVEVPEF